MVNTLGMNTKNYYLLIINKLPLPDHIVRYNNRLPLELSKVNFEHTLNLIAGQDFLKFYTEGIQKWKKKFSNKKSSRCLRLYSPKPRALKARRWP